MTATSSPSTRRPGPDQPGPAPDRRAQRGRQVHPVRPAARPCHRPAVRQRRRDRRAAVARRHGRARLRRRPGRGRRTGGPDRRTTLVRHRDGLLAPVQDRAARAGPGAWLPDHVACRHGPRGPLRRACRPAGPGGRTRRSRGQDPGPSPAAVRPGRRRRRHVDETVVYDNSRARPAFRVVARFERGRVVGAPDWPSWTPDALRALTR
jgi:hypothetical protein